MIHRLTLRQGRGVNRQSLLKLKRSLVYMLVMAAGQPTLFRMINELNERDHKDQENLLDQMGFRVIEIF